MAQCAEPMSFRHRFLHVDGCLRACIRPEQRAVFFVRHQRDRPGRRRRRHRGSPHAPVCSRPWISSGAYDLRCAFSALAVDCYRINGDIPSFAEQQRVPGPHCGVTSVQGGLLFNLLLTLTTQQLGASACQCRRRQRHQSFTVDESFAGPAAGRYSLRAQASWITRRSSSPRRAQSSISH